MPSISFVNVGLPIAWTPRRGSERTRQTRVEVEAEAAACHWEDTATPRLAHVVSYRPWNALLNWILADHVYFGGIRITSKG
jgi:hypothetical protein